MNFLNNLASAIKKKNSGIELSEVEKLVYEQAYCDCLGKNSGVGNRDSEVFDYYCSLFKTLLNDKDMFKFKVFNGLLYYNKSSVPFSDFCNFCGVNSFDLEVQERIINSINSWVDSEDEKIEFNGRDSLLIIDSLDDIKVGDNTTSRNLKFAIITGLNIGGKCIDSDGKIDEVKLYDSLINYVNFKDRFLSDMKENDIKLDGIVFMGDLFDIFSDSYAKANTYNRVINSLVKKIVTFTGKNEDMFVIDDCDFVTVVSGHKDVWLGDKLTATTKIFGDKAMYLGKFGPCTMVKNDYKHFSEYLYNVYTGFLRENRIDEGNLCYFIPPDVALDLRIRDGSYDVTICDLGVDGIKVLDYNANTITYDSKLDDYGVKTGNISRIKFKNK